jgi:3-oxoacyl-[acyl-carrier-protein] synthase-1/3-oxoacyl-[acyl-carrier-protein] synthase II
MSASVLAVGAISALGVGNDAFSVGALGKTARVAVGTDPELARAGLLRPVAARVLARLIPTAIPPRYWRFLLMRVPGLSRARPGFAPKVGLASGRRAGR